MKNTPNLNIFLLYLFLLCLLILLLTQTIFHHQILRNDVAQMSSAVELAENWMSIIDHIKNRDQQNTKNIDNRKFLGLLGEEYSEITTTLGSLEAKKISLNPQFAALTVKFLNDADIDSTKIVGIILSGSFPGIAISVLAALQTLKINAIIMSSLGASSYGANNPEATWLDIENWLNIYGGMKYKSVLVSLGGDNDTGEGLSDTGIEIMKNAITRTQRTLYVPNSLRESIEKHVQILIKNNVDLLINIGGTHASLGECIHNTTIPNGYISKLNTCNDSLRGIMFRFSELGKPIIHFLNIKNLAIKNGIPFDYDPESKIPPSLCYSGKYEIIPIIISLVVVFLLLFLNYYKRNFN